MGNSNSAQVIGPYYTDRKVLNSDAILDSYPLPPESYGRVPYVDDKTLAGYLKGFIMDIKADHMSRDGLSVDYTAVRQSPKFRQYVFSTSHLRSVRLSDFSETEKKAFYINIYNALVIHALVEGLLTDASSTFQRMVFFARSSYDIGGHVFTLNDIENGLLRANRQSPLPFTALPFGKSDPRKEFMMDVVDARLHFALNCGAQSCPPISDYSYGDEELHAQLNMATEGFIENEVHILKKESIIKVSMLFFWYQLDFGGSEANMLRWIVDHASLTKSQKLVKFMEQSPDFAVKYTTYNWSLNNMN